MSDVTRALLHALAALGLMLANGVVLIWMLRKVLGHLHVRLGPTINGPFGLFQTLFDVVKLLTKEDFLPTNVDRWLFRLAPIVVFTPSLMAYIALPFSPTWRFADLDSGLLFTFAVLSLVPIGILMAGWASSNKWSLLGGMRAAAQQIAYEVPLLLSVLSVVLVTGSMNLSDIVDYQSGRWFFDLLPRWFAFGPQIVAFVLFAIAALAELNQTPFDLSEAESELIAGFANEYSGMRFGLLFLAEFSNSFVMSALGVTLFFGGWTIPWLEHNEIALTFAPLVFMLKTYLGIAVLMWIRGTLPRVRIDQMLAMSWKGLIPASLVWITLTGVLMKAVG